MALICPCCSALCFASFVCAPLQSHRALCEGVSALARRVQSDRELTNLIRRKFAIKCTTGAAAAAAGSRQLGFSLPYLLRPRFAHVNAISNSLVSWLHSQHPLQQLRVFLC
jgi:hypothetical protein